MARTFGRTRPSKSGDFVIKKAESKQVRDTHERPLPPPTGQAPYRLDLADVLEGSNFAENLQAIQQAGRITFQLSGDTGSSPNSDNREQLNVINGLESQFSSQGSPHDPAFFYSCGDCIYFNGLDSQYYAQFYEPYEHYPGPIFAIPGNHDGENLPGQTSLDAFVKNFCSKQPVHLPEAADIPRTAMTQPNVYWTLLAPMVRIIGLYTNVNPGGAISDTQYEWLVGELEAAKHDESRAVFLTMHHPIYSLDDFHSGSPHVQEPVIKAIQKAGRYPDIVIGAHVHNMQRFTVPLGKNKGVVPYLVAGTGGYNNLHHMQKNVVTTGVPLSVHDPDINMDIILESYSDDRHGFWNFTVTAQNIIGEYYTVPRPQDPYTRGARLFDRFSYNRLTRAFEPNPLVTSRQHVVTPPSQGVKSATHSRRNKA